MINLDVCQVPSYAINDKIFCFCVEFSSQLIVRKKYVCNDLRWNRILILNYDFLKFQFV
jgi:hypothetical protein